LNPRPQPVGYSTYFLKGSRCMSGTVLFKSDLVYFIYTPNLYHKAKFVLRWIQKGRSLTTSQKKRWKILSPYLLNGIRNQFNIAASKELVAEGIQHVLFFSNFCSNNCYRSCCNWTVFAIISAFTFNIREDCDRGYSRSKR
jgi:hypothetical protein